MGSRAWLRSISAVALPALLLAGCFDEPPNRPGVVFLDALESGIEFQPFFESNYETLADDTSVKYAGDAAMRLEVLTAPWSGGAFVATPARDLSGYNALTFWARSDKSVSLNSIGIGNDNTGTSLYQTELKNLPLTPTWTRYVVPVPAPSKLREEAGLLWFADAAEGGTAHRIWLDEVKFASVDASTWNPRPVMTATTAQLAAGDTYDIVGTAVTHTVDGVEVRQLVFPSTFDYTSSDTSIATVDARGVVTAVATGTATISATLEGVEVPQEITVQVMGGLAPTTGPAAPTHAAADVIALFSDAYDLHAVDNLGASWSNSEQGPRLTYVTLGADQVLKYTNLLYVGIEFTGANIVNASTMTHVHVDLWTKDATVFKVKLVDFGADGISNYPAAGDDKEHELTFNAGSSPALVSGQWISFDLPLSSFTTITNRSHLAQLVLSADTKTVFVDNLYFHK